MQRFFVEPGQIDSQTHLIRVTGPDVNHMKNVLRLRPGEEVWISDGKCREYHCTIEAYEGQEALLHILYSQEPDYELPCRICLFQGIPKSDKMEFIIQKGVELGASDIIPLRLARCVARLEGEKAVRKTARWQQISESAAKQSRRMKIPTVHPPMDLKEALAFASELDILLVPYELAGDMSHTREVLSGVRPGRSLGIFIGPEGGFEEAEVTRILEAGGQAITLGRRILRTETAGMTLLSVLMYLLEE